MNKHRQKKVGCVTGFLILLVVVPLCCLVSAFPEGHYLVPRGREHAHLVSELFLSALVDHQTRTLRALSDDELDSHIDNWLETHQEVDCDGPLWWELLDIPPITHQFFVDEPDYKQESLVLYRQCANIPMNYCVKMSNIQLRLTDEGWMVENWEAVQEELVADYAVCPFEPRPVH